MSGTLNRCKRWDPSPTLSPTATDVDLRPFGAGGVIFSDNVEDPSREKKCHEKSS